MGVGDGERVAAGRYLGFVRGGNGGLLHGVMQRLAVGTDSGQLAPGCAPAVRLAKLRGYGIALLVGYRLGCIAVFVGIPKLGGNGLVPVAGFHVALGILPDLVHAHRGGVVGRLQVAMERTDVALGGNRHVVADEGAAGAAGAERKGGAGRQNACRALMHRDGKVACRVVEVVQHVPRVAEHLVDLADADVLAVHAQVGLRDIDGAGALAIDVDNQRGIALDGEVVDVDALIAALQLGSRQRNVGAALVAVVDGDVAHLAVVDELLRCPDRFLGGQARLQRGKAGLQGVQVDEGRGGGVDVLHHGVRLLDAAAVQQQLAVVARRKVHAAAEHDAAVFALVPTGEGAGVVLHVAQRVVAVDVHELLAGAVVHRRSEVLHQDVAVHIDRRVQRIEGDDMEAVGDAERIVAVAILVVRGQVEAVGLRVLGVGDVAVLGSRNRRVAARVGVRLLRDGTQPQHQDGRHQHGERLRRERARGNRCRNRVRRDAVRVFAFHGMPHLHCPYAPIPFLSPSELRFALAAKNAMAARATTASTMPAI